MFRLTLNRSCKYLSTHTFFSYVGTQILLVQYSTYVAYTFLKEHLVVSRPPSVSLRLSVDCVVCCIDRRHFVEGGMYGYGPGSILKSKAPHNKTWLW